MVSLRLVCPGLSFKKIVPIIKNQAVNLQTNDTMESQRVYGFLVVLLLILPGKNFSQQQMPLIAQKMPHALQSFSMSATQRAHSIRYFLGQSLTNIPDCNLNNHPFHIINSNFYTNHFGFFCRHELLFEKMTYVPLRFRLGSLDYVNKMEGKYKSAVSQ
jgi:hypothetical protein